jgi:hypothetical protein
MAAGRLELELVDVAGRPLADTVDLLLRHQVLKEEVRVADQDGRKVIALAGLRTEPQGLYKLEITPRSYWPVARFVTIPASGSLRERVTLPIKPHRVRAIHPAFDDLDDRVRGVLARSDKVKGHEGRSGAALYAALGAEATAGLLNIAKKTLTVPFVDGDDLLNHVTVLDIREDRCFVDVPLSVKAQIEAMVQDELFNAVDGSLHTPPERFVPAGSFKTPDAFGNLQMTFFTCDDRCVADIDIDDAAGLGHVFQVIRNHLTGKPTHPYNIHQILMKHQHLHPGYDLVPA